MNEPQPKVFVGEYQELYALAKEHYWNINKIRVVNNVESVNRIRGLRLKREDIRYGKTIDNFSSNTLWRLYQEFQLLGIEYTGS